MAWVVPGPPAPSKSPRLSATLGCIPSCLAGVQVGEDEDEDEDEDYGSRVTKTGDRTRQHVVMKLSPLRRFTSDNKQLQ